MKFKGNLKQLVVFIIMNRKEFKGANEMEIEFDTELKNRYLTIKGNLNGIETDIKGTETNGILAVDTLVIDTKNEVQGVSAFTLNTATSEKEFAMKVVSTKTKAELTATVSKKKGVIDSEASMEVNGVNQFKSKTSVNLGIVKTING